MVEVCHGLLFFQQSIRSKTFYTQKVTEMNTLQPVYTIETVHVCIFFLAFLIFLETVTETTTAQANLVTTPSEERTVGLGSGSQQDTDRRTTATEKGEIPFLRICECMNTNTQTNDPEMFTLTHHHSYTH